MSIGYVIVIAVIAVASFVTSYILSQEAKKALSHLNDYSKVALADFSVTQQSEGMVIPILYGNAVLSGNLIWWKAERVGGSYYRYRAWLTLCMGDVLEGWRYSSPYGLYWLDLYKASRQQRYDIYVDDIPRFFAFMPDLYMTYDEGSTAVSLIADVDRIKRWSPPYHFLQTGTNMFPVKSVGPAFDFIPDALANFSGYPLKSVTHVCVGMHQYENYATGINTPPSSTWIDLESGVAQIPNFSFYVGRTFNATEISAKLLRYNILYLNQQIMFSTVDTYHSGNNPAVVYYDLLVNKIYGGNIDESKIDVDNFVVAAKYFLQQEYGLNFVINQKQSIKDIITRIQLWTNSFLTKDQNDLYVIKILKDEDKNNPLAIITDAEMINFSLRRKSWDETFNCFVGTYYPRRESGRAYVYQTISGGEQIYAAECAFRNDYPTTITLKDEANIELTKSQREKSVDLSCFMSGTAARNRLTQIMRQESYPFMNGSLTLNLTYLYLRPGDVVIIRSDEYGIETSFRVTSISYSEIDSNQITLSIMQL